MWLSGQVVRQMVWYLEDLGLEVRAQQATQSPLQRAQARRAEAGGAGGGGGEGSQRAVGLERMGVLLEGIEQLWCPFGFPLNHAKKGAEGTGGTP